jgi:hypothetical protein
MEHTAEFSFRHEKMMRLLDKVVETHSDADIDCFAEAMWEFTKLFGHMGKTLELAFSDITTKAEILRKRAGEHPGMGLQTLIEKEVREGTSSLNGDNFSKFKVDTRYKNYTSAARTTLRLMWFMDYVYEFMKLVDTERTESISVICKEAYERSLAPHHPWTIRSVAKISMMAAPSSRDKVFSMLWSGIEHEQVYRQIQEMMEKLGLIRVHFWTYYRRNKLDNLP